MEVAVKPEATPLPQRNSAANVQTTPQVKPLIPAKTEAGSVPMQVDATFVAPNNATGERKNNRNSNFGGQRGRGGAGGGGNGGGNNNAGGGGNNNRFNNRGGGGGGNNSGNNNNRNNQNNFQNRRQNPQNKQNQDVSTFFFSKWLFRIFNFLKKNSINILHLYLPTLKLCSLKNFL